MQTQEADQLWPPQDYYQQLERLRQAIGQTIYLAEIRDTAMNAGVKISDEEHMLLAVIDFPQPDPYRQLCPHMIILDDGRGINLGRIARISINRAFAPGADDILFQGHEFINQVLFAPRQLSHQSIASTSRSILTQIFGDEPGRLLAECQSKNTLTPTPLPQKERGKYDK